MISVPHLWCTMISRQIEMTLPGCKVGSPADKRFDPRLAGEETAPTKIRFTIISHHLGGQSLEFHMEKDTNKIVIMLTESRLLLWQSEFSHA